MLLARDPTIKVCEDTRGMPRMFVTLSSDCLLCCHSLILVVVIVLFVSWVWEELLLTVRTFD